MLVLDASVTREDLTLVGTILTYSADDIVEYVRCKTVEQQAAEIEDAQSYAVYPRSSWLASVRERIRTSGISPESKRIFELAKYRDAYALLVLYLDVLAGTTDDDVVATLSGSPNDIRAYIMTHFDNPVPPSGEVDRWLSALGSEGIRRPLRQFPGRLAQRTLLMMLGDLPPPAAGYTGLLQTVRDEANALRLPLTR